VDKPFNFYKNSILIKAYSLKISWSSGTSLEYLPSIGDIADSSVNFIDFRVKSEL